MKAFFAVATGLFLALFLGVCLAVAQETTPAPETKPAALGRTRTVKEAARILEADAKVAVLAESSVARSAVSLPPVGDAARPLAERLTALVAQLPRGTRWMKLFLPAPPPGSRFRADDVADLVVTQEKLFGAKGDAVAVTDQAVAERDAAAKSDSTPVYLILNARAHLAMAFRGGDFAQMTPEQRKEWAKSAADAFKNLPPDARAKIVADMLRMPNVFLKELMGSLSGAEGEKFLTEMGAEVKNDGNTGTITFKPNDE